MLQEDAKKHPWQPSARPSKARCSDTKRVWQITSLPPLLGRLFMEQQKVLWNIPLCKEGWNPTQHSTAQQPPSRAAHGRRGALLWPYRGLPPKDRTDAVGGWQYRNASCRARGWKFGFVSLFLNEIKLCWKKKKKCSGKATTQLFHIITCIKGLFASLLWKQQYLLQNVF